MGGRDGPHENVAQWCHRLHLKTVDNAMAESFFATLKRELMPEEGWSTKEEARAAVFEWIAVYYNRQRRHSGIAYRTPVDFETSKDHLRAA